MPNPKQPNKPKSTEDILREMEEMSGNETSAEASSSDGGGGGALKSLLGFFVKVTPDEDEAPPIKMPASPPPQARPAPRVGPRVGDLVADEPAPKFTPPPIAVSPSEPAVDLANKSFEDIYREAGVPPSQCSVDELAKLLENPMVANQPMNIKVVAVGLTLSAKGITAEVPVTDALRRDRALDAYQAMLSERVVSTEARNAGKIQQITKEVEEYLKRKQAEMDTLKAEIAAVKTQSVEFAIRREIEEKRLADLIAPFLEGKANPVTIGNSPEPPKPSA